MDRGTRLIAHFGTLSVKTLALLRLGQLGEVLRIAQAGKELADENDPRPVTHSGGISQKTTVLDKPNRVHTHRSPTMCDRRHSGWEHKQNIFVARITFLPAYGCTINMAARFNIFRHFGSSNRAWLTSAPSLDAAKDRIAALAKHLPGIYVIRDSTTGKEMALKAG
jgi:hypothetical protein